MHLLHLLHLLHVRGEGMTPSHTRTSYEPIREGHTSSRLAPEDIEAVANRVVELLCARETEATLVSASELATRLSVSVSWIYAHAASLGAIRLSDGPKSGLRFDPEEAAKRLIARHARERPPVPVTRKAKRKSKVPADGLTPAGAQWVPIHGQGGR